LNHCRVGLGSWHCENGRHADENIYKKKKKKTKLKNLQEAVDGSRVVEMVVLKEDLHNLLEQEKTRWL
jgi:hypothetical protein